MNRMYNGVPTPHERVIMAAADHAPAVVNAGAGMYFEPYDYLLTAREVYTDPYNPWSYGGFLPFVPSGVGKLKKLIDDIPHLRDLPNVPPRKLPSGGSPSSSGGKPSGGKPNGDSCPTPNKLPLDGPPGFSNPVIGQEVHDRFAKALTEQTNTTSGDWIFRTDPGMKGVDASYRGPAFGHPRFDHAELKPYSVHGFNTFQDQLNRWDLPEGTTQLWFYGHGGVIGTSGLNY